ncbi:MAG: hypothetical protein ACREQ5_01075 [Candidatus Dormibacteria bacterium]
MNIAEQAKTAEVAATARRDEQVETVKRLNALSSLDWTVDADALTRVGGIPEVATDMCANDSDHGLATCYWADEEDGLCPDCAVRILIAVLVVGSYISVDVLQ